MKRAVLWWVVGVGLLLLVWQLAYWAIRDDAFLPSPSAVAQTLVGGVPPWVSWTRD